MTEENSKRGRSNRLAGYRALLSGVKWLRDNGAPNADYVTQAHSSDYVGLGIDAAIERTVEGWQQLGKKADQAVADARRRGLDRWCVWKPRRGVSDQGRAWCITEFAQWWADQRELAELRATVETYREAFGPLGRARAVGPRS